MSGICHLFHMNTGYFFIPSKPVSYLDLEKYTEQVVTEIFPGLVQVWTADSQLQTEFFYSETDAYQRSIFGIRTIKHEKKYLFVAEMQYSSLYVMRRVLNNVALHFNAKVIEVATQSVMPVEPQQFKNFLDFLRKSFPDKKKGIRKFYLDELKKMPEEIRNAEGAINNFL